MIHEKNSAIFHLFSFICRLITHFYPIYNFLILLKTKNINNFASFNADCFSALIIVTFSFNTEWPERVVKNRLKSGKATLSCRLHQLVDSFDSFDVLTCIENWLFSATVSSNRSAWISDGFLRTFRVYWDLALPTWCFALT